DRELTAEEREERERERDRRKPEEHHQEDDPRAERGLGAAGQAERGHERVQGPAYANGLQRAADPEDRGRRGEDGYRHEEPGRRVPTQAHAAMMTQKHVSSSNPFPTRGGMVRRVEGAGPLATGVFVAYMGIATVVMVIQGVEILPDRWVALLLMGG